MPPQGLPDGDPTIPPSEKPPYKPPEQKPPSPFENNLANKEKRSLNLFKNKSLKRSRASKTSSLQNINPELVARRRTSENTMRLVAGLAIQFAIKSRRPETQNKRVREAEHGYLNKLWDSYTRRALRIGR